MKTHGLLAYKVALGAEVKEGDVIADLIDLDGEGFASTRTPIHAGTDGVVISRNMIKYVQPGVSIAKIAGSVPWPHAATTFLKIKLPEGQILPEML